MSSRDFKPARIITTILGIWAIWSSRQRCASQIAWRPGPNVGANYRQRTMAAPSVACNALIEAPDKEAVIKRNPHRDWNEVESSRPDYASSNVWTASKTPVPAWQAGDGSSDNEWEKHKRITVRPYEDGRTTVQNYKLMISTTVPRPIALVTTTSRAGVGNMAPISYFQNVCADVSNTAP